MNNCNRCGAKDATETVGTKEGFFLTCIDCIEKIPLAKLKKRINPLPSFKIHEKKDKEETTVDIFVVEKKDD